MPKQSYYLGETISLSSAAQEAHFSSCSHQEHILAHVITKATYFMPKKQSIQLRMKFQKQNIEQRTPQIELLKH